MVYLTSAEISPVASPGGNNQHMSMFVFTCIGAINLADQPRNQSNNITRRNQSTLVSVYAIHTKAINLTIQPEISPVVCSGVANQIKILNLSFHKIAITRHQDFSYHFSFYFSKFFFKKVESKKDLEAINPNFFRFPCTFSKSI